jgi:hypothetical protein
MGSQASLGQGDRGGPQLPGLENLGADAIVAGGITVDPNIPSDMQFIPSSIPDGDISFSVASTGMGGSYPIAVKSPCMTFEDFYAAFSKDSHPSLSVTPSTGRLDRRSGERTFFPGMLYTLVCYNNLSHGCVYCFVFLLHLTQKRPTFSFPLSLWG